ncbi:fluoride efflux transporter CrcB [Heyndrickxia ginsengihumi]|uniref:Fluoride-specific ion channel FluC n=1 Tax=Heyndrickxia ginsengihumi TaxID=363870 RepID=A0A0A6VD35_9BACI|nr:fluoride efflux transporter CrcB [Heyndrickxia ginsengihumi]KHD85388.1 camphor resistance protein CrcB [Heyndrickxia ginsengihumi]MBE6183052.1 fluoride efflux transporter CrcB [Bacillus sp. (in: firmicutes)]MCM3022600.1 fluoride efflux transporter CrcB [Heyndrickxia ginsengihumi]NEY19064.1 fluoride efflux transporter CrcB [Heyndrickxia ginsengihumi]
MALTYLFVGIGGVIGAILRYTVGLLFQHIWNGAFPLPTLTINLIGCFILGWLTSYAGRRNILPPYVMTGITTGIIGSFTTFSTFSVETVQLFQSSQWLLAMLYLALSCILGLAFASIGYTLGKKDKQRGISK